MDSDYHTYDDDDDDDDDVAYIYKNKIMMYKGVTMSLNCVATLYSLGRLAETEKTKTSLIK